MTDIIVERNKTHGDWDKQSTCAQLLKTVIRANNNSRITLPQREALEMIAVKMSRILNGNPNESDHWDDIIGYARLGKGESDR